MKGKGLKQFSSNDFFNYLTDLGLMISDKSGGELIQDYSIAKVQKIQDHHFNLIHSSGERSVIVDPNSFNRKLMETELSMDLKFFA